MTLRASLDQTHACIQNPKGKEKFVEVQQAYEILGDPEKKHRHDMGWEESCRIYIDERCHLPPTNILSLRTPPVSTISSNITPTINITGDTITEPSPTRTLFCPLRRYRSPLPTFSTMFS